MSNKISFKNSLRKVFYVGIFFLFGVLGKDFIKKQIFNFKEFQYKNAHTKNLKVLNCPIDSISIAIFGQSNSSNSVPRENQLIYQRIYINLIGGQKIAWNILNHF